MEFGQSVATTSAKDKLSGLTESWTNNWNILIQYKTYITKYNCQFLNAFFSLQCLNKDGVPIELVVSLQYRARKSALYRIATEFRDHESYVEILTVIGEYFLSVPYPSKLLS